MGVTYEAAREALQTSGEQHWLGTGFGDPHDWVRALLGVLSTPLAMFTAGWSVVLITTGVWVQAPYLALAAVPVLRKLYVLVRARCVVNRAGEGTPARYVLARGSWDDPCLVLFPPEGDDAPWGTVRLVDSRGGVPLTGDVTLLAGLDRTTRRPRVGSVVVPMLPSGPLWPTGALREVQAEEGQLKADGVALRPIVGGGDRVGASSADARPAQGRTDRSPGLRARAGSVVDYIFGGAPNVAYESAGWIGLLVELTSLALFGYSLTLPGPAVWFALVFGMFAPRAVAQAATGASPGQRVRGLKVVGAQGRRPSWGACALRNAVAALLVASVVGIPLLLLPAIRRPDRRCLHDLLAGTRVVLATPKPDASLGPERRDGRAGAISTAPTGPGVDCPEATAE